MVTILPGESAFSQGIEADFEESATEVAFHRKKRIGRG
jgi:hypothetical protein